MSIRNHPFDFFCFLPQRCSTHLSSNNCPSSNSPIYMWWCKLCHNCTVFYLNFNGTLPNAHFDNIGTSNTHNSYVMTKLFTCPNHKNLERHIAHTIISWPNPKQWVIVHTSDLMTIIRQSIYILSIFTREMSKLKTHNPTYCLKDNWENMLNLIHTLDKIYLTGIL